MAWEDVEEDERELLRSVDYEARKRHYRALRGGLLWYLVAVLTTFLAIFLFAKLVLEME